MSSVPGFIISGDGSYNFISDVSGTYNMIKFKTGNFTVQPTTNIALYDLFLVGGGIGGKIGDTSGNLQAGLVNSRGGDGGNGDQPAWVCAELPGGRS